MHFAHLPQKTRFLSHPRSVLCSCVPPVPQPPLYPTTTTKNHRVDDCFVKDEMAKKSENLANRPFLREGVVPVVGLSLYLQV